MNVLKHYGVKGMRWGVRRSSTTNPTIRSSLLNTKISRLSTSQINKGRSYALKNSDGIILPSKDYGRVMSEIHTYDPDCRQKDNIDYHDSSDGYTYTYRNRYGDEPLIIGKHPIKNIHD